MNKRILIVAGGTGGHFFPAQALFDELKQHQYIVRMVTDQRCKHYITDIKNTNIINVKRLSGSYLCKTWGFVCLPLAILQSLMLFIKFKPNLVIIFGGYTSLPHLFTAFITRKKLILHEQNTVCGKANLLFAPIADIIAVSYQDTQKLTLYNQKLLYTGNFVRPLIKKKQSTLQNTQFTIFIIGGSMGAQYFATHITNAVIKLSRTYSKIKIIQQVQQDDLIKVQAKYNQEKINYELASFFVDINQKYQEADLVIARSGASTIAELIKLQMPSILIPLPHSSDNHQYYNAKYLSDHQAAILLNQTEVDKALPALLTKLITLPEELSSMKQILTTLQIDGTKILLHKIKALM